jgi:hypothetical protein
MFIIDRIINWLNAWQGERVYQRYRKEMFDKDIYHPTINPNGIIHGGMNSAALDAAALVERLSGKRPRIKYTKSG